MKWKNILKNDPKMPPMPEVPKRQKPTEAGFERLLRETIIPAMKKKGNGPYRFNREEDKEIYYPIASIIEDNEEDGLIRAFGKLYGRDPEITRENDNVIVEFYDSRRNPFNFQPL